MKTTHILGIFLIFNFFLLSAQDGLNISGANISITPGATIRIDKGDLRISGNAEVKNEAQISVDGNWLNNNTTGQIFTTDSEGIVTLTKTTDITTIGGTTTTLFYNLILDVDQVTLEVNTIVGGSVSGSNLGVLNLKDVSLNLNSNSLQISNSLIGAIITDEGYIISEDVLNQSKVLWQTSPTGAMYTVPFGTVSGAKIPLSIERAAGDLGQITVSTYPTGLNMTPFPTQPETVSSTETTNGSNLINKSINRFWQLDKTGAGTANLTFSYADAEVPSGGENDLSSYRFNTTLNKWESKGVSAIDIANNTVTVSGVNEFSPWTLGGGTPEDFDGDGIVNENDLDNDNDGILDADEGVCTPNQSGNWGGFTNNITYDYLDGVVVRITNAAAHLNLNNFNPAGAGFWSENLAGDPSALGSFDFGESVIISFEDAAGNPVKVTNPAIHFDRLGESDGTTQNSAEITLQDGLTWRKLGGTDDFITTTTTARDGGAGLTAALAAGGYSAESTQNDIDGTAAGSLQIQGVISTFTLTFPKAEPTTGTQDIIEMIIFACKQIDDDNDGTPNFLDVDSDGDGCPDAIEGGANHDYDDLDEYNSLTATVDATGVPGGTSQTLGTSQDKTQQSAECSECHPTHPSYVDSDNDTIGDFCDVDDDNDGILDTDEYGEIDCVDAITPLFGIAQGPNPINGSDPANPLVGNSFLYINVYSGIDAIIKIESSTDTEILDFDVSGSGIEDHFQPQITHSTGDGYTEFSIQFVLTGTSIPAPKTNYLVTAVDNDIREYIAFEDSVDEVYVDTPTDQDVYSGIGTNGGFSNAYVSNGVLENGIIVNTPNTHVSGLYPQTNKVIFRLGNTDGSISNHSIGFTPCIPQDFWNTPPTLIGAIDTDSDGITDDLDNDSDSDGCPDALEGNGTYTFTDIDGSGALTATPNANGLPGTAQGIGTSKDSSQKNGECDECNSGHPLFVDTDGDGYGDYCDDLDDDNDGILDTDECLVEHPIEWSHNADSGNSDFATYGSDNNQTMTSSFSAASNISFGAGLDESVNYSYTYILDDADQLTYANAKANNDYVEMSYTVANNVILKAIDGGFYTNGPSDPDATLGFFKIALEMSTSPTFGTSTLIFKDKQIGDLSVAPNYVSFSDNYSISLIAGTTYYFRYYLYDEQNSDATDNRVRFDDIRYRHDSGCDTDNDGTPDFQDNDSDGDGCPDALEGDGSNTYADLDSNLRLIAAVNGNGIPAGTSQGVGTSTDDTLQADECSPCDPSHPSYVDSDGDAIGDFCDLDDDNDGILDTVECAAVYYNDSFETPNLSIDTASPPNKPDGDLDGEIDLFINQTAIEGWTVSNGGTFDIIYDLFNANDGLQSIDLYGSPTASNIQKTYTGFTAGTTVDFSLDYSSAEAAFEASVYVNSGSGRTLVAILQPSSVATINGASGVGNRVSTVVWSTFSTQLTPTATSITIEIESSGLLGTGSTGVLIDNIILSQACNDTDGDGTTDDKDIDSDNDGCADAIEAGHLDDDNDGEVDGSGYDANGQVTGAITAYTGTINGVTTASETSIDTAPTDQEERVGDDAVFSVVASALDASAYASGTPTYDINANAGLTYQWQVSTNSGSTFSDIGGANSASLTVADVTLLMDGNIYKVLVSSANNSCPEEAQATLNVINNVDAIDDSAGITAIDGFFGATDILNVFDNDEFNGAVLNPASVTITPVTNGPLTVNTDGSVDIASNTGTGSYTVNYQICDATNSANCDIAIVTVNVGVNSLPTAQDDEVSVAQDTSNNSIDVLANNGNGPDSFGGDGPNTGAITLPSTTTTNGGTVSVDNNSTPLDPTDDTVLYTPAVGYSGADSFTYTITDANTDASTATVNVTVIPTPTISISVVALDDIVNATEDDSPVTISGTTTNVEDGQTVTVVLNGTTYSPTVLSNAWTFDISATEAQALDPTETITADVSNVAGNVAVQATRDIQHVVTTPIVTISVVAVDDIINATEDDSPVTISGTTTNVEDGQTVTVVLNGTTYSPTVLSNAWTFDITATEAQALDPTETITADVNNVAGNTAVQATRDIQHDAIAPIPVLEIDDITVDNILNATEAGADVAVTGTVSGDFNTGDTVTLTVDGTDYTGTVDALGAYSIDVPGSKLAADADTTVDGSVTTTDAAGNSASATDTQLYSVDTTAPTIVINVVAVDDIINATEDDNDVTINGTTTNVEDGQTVTVTLNGETYTTTVSGNTWTLDIPAADAQALDPTETITADVSDLGGNPATQATRDIQHDAIAPIPVLDIDDITADNILNATEAGADVAVTGTVSGDFNTGDTVTLTVDGTDYTGTVNALGVYSIDVPGSKLAVDADTTVDGSVTTTDAAGNSASATDTQLYSVDTTLPVPVLEIDDITADNILNATEAGADVAVTGTVSGDFNTGDTVTLTVDGTDYTGTVDALGAYSIDVPGSKLAADADTTVDGSVTTTDAAGNSASATDTQLYSVDTTAPAIVINVVAIDDIINATEDDNDVTINGTTTNVEDGQTVTVTLNGETYTTTVSGNTWTLDIPAADAQALDPTETITANVSDLGGNPATQATRDIQHDAIAPIPVLDIDDITADNILNATEAGANVAVTGTVSGDFNTGDTVTLTVDGTDYTGTVNALGVYSIDVPGSKLAADADTTVDGSVTTTDAAGNSASATDTQLYSVDTTLPVPVLEIDDITADNILNATEAGADVAVTGTVSGDFNTGDTVTLTVDGTDYTGTVNALGVYSIDVPGSKLAADADTTVDGSVTTTDAAGNSASATDTQLYSVDTTLPVPVLDIDDITADNILNATEAGADVAVTGTVSGDFNTGDTVTLTVDGTDYTGTVDALGAYSIDVPGSKLAADADTTVDGSVTTTDAAGNSASATDTQLYSVDTTAPTIVINVVAVDDIINATEDDNDVTINGTTTNVEDGQTVTVTLNGETYTTTVSGNTWTLDIPAADAQALDPTETITANVSDLGGNPATQATRDIQHDAIAPIPVLDIDDITADNILNATEAGADVAVTGTVSGDFNTGDTVTLTVDGTDYTGTVNALGVYSIDVPGSKLAADADTTVDGSVTTTDAAGNSASATDTQLYSVDTTLPVPVLDIDDITADNILNATEAGADVAVTGTVSGDFNTGDTVTLTVDGTDYTGTVDALGAYSIDVPGSKLAADADTTVDGSVTTTDAAGNSASATDTQLYSVDTTAPTIVINVVAVDDIINATEDDNDVTINGTTTNVEDGQTVTVTLNGETYTTTVSGNTWTLDIPAADAQALDPTETITANVSDLGGNPATQATRDIQHDAIAPIPVLDIDDITADNILNATEAGADVAVTGTVSGDFNTGDTVTLTVDGTDYTGTVNALGVYSIDVPGSKLAADADTTVDGSVTTTDAAGNSASATDTQLYSVDTTAPAIVINVVAIDDIINATEDDNDVTINGTTTNVEDGQTVTVTLNGETYTTTVSGNTWTLDIPAADAQALDPTETITANVSDLGGNPATQATRDIQHDAIAPIPVLEIDDITADNILNATEAGADVAVTGTVSGDFNTGDTVTLTVDGTDYTGTVNTLGVYSIDVPGSKLAADADTTVDGSVTTTDAAGNSASATDTQLYSVDTTLPVPVLEIDDITADNILNATEAGADVAVTGTVSGDFNTGDTVTLTVDGTDYTGTVNALGVYSIDVPGSKLAADADTTVDGSVTTTDAAGNSASATDTQLYSVDTTLPIPVLEIDDITVDNILNATEAGADVAVTGTVSGDFNTGDTVTLTVDGTDYTGTVNALGVYSIDVPGSKLAADADTTVDGSVTTTDAAGNSASATDTQLYSVDTTAPAIVINVVAVDDIINATEDDNDVTINGTTTNVEDGQTVTVTLNGETYTTTVSGNTWTLDIPAADAQALDPTETITANVSDLGGNPATQATRDIQHDVMSPVITIDVVAVDDIINATEDDSPVTISGTTTNVEDGQTVTIVLNGTTYTTIVTGGIWSRDIPVGKIQALDANETITADVSDLSGNPAIHAIRDIEYDIISPLITIDVVAVDDIINALEDDSPVTISGTTDAEDGQIITVVLNGTNYTTTVTGGVWTLDITATDAQALDPTETITADVIDIAGNPAVQVTKDIEHDVDASINITTPIEGDGIVNATEDGDVTISGTTTNVEDNQVVTVTFNDGINTPITTTAIVIGNTWTATDIDISGLENGNITITADVIDVAQNSATDSETVILDNNNITAPTVIVTEDLNNDGLLSDSELVGDIGVQVILPVAAVAGDTVTVTDGNGNSENVILTPVDINNGTIDVAFVSPGDGGTLIVIATITDISGNVGPDSAAENILLDLTAPSAPTVVITEDINNDGVLSDGELTGNIGVQITLPVDAIIGDTVTVTDGNGNSEVVILTPTDINNGSIVVEFVSPGDGGTIVVTAAITDIAGNVGPNSTTDTAVIDSTTPIVDSDGDGLNDDEEVILGTDPNNPDSDGDLINDGQEVNTDNTDPLDDCSSNGGTALPNSDCDVDGLTTAEESTLGTDPTNPDSDNDGLEDGEEVILGTDPLNPDSDGDLINDGQEVTDATNPLDDCDSVGGTVLSNSDCDADGLTTSQEVAIGTDPNNADSDGDLINDGREVTDGTDPLDGCSSNGGTTPAGVVCDITIESDLINPNTNNGVFTINNIESFPNNTVRVYNRWGVLVFETNGYDNSSNAFRGISNGRVTVKKNDELPVGVYFYIIDYTSDQKSRTMNGYIYINR